MEDEVLRAMRQYAGGSSWTYSMNRLRTGNVSPDSKSRRDSGDVVTSQVALFGLED
jgi:hypothetical protein